MLNFSIKIKGKKIKKNQQQKVEGSRKHLDGERYYKKKNVTATVQLLPA